MAVVHFAGARYPREPAETVLEALLAGGAEVPYACRAGVCLACLMRVREGTVPAPAQAGLRETLKETGHFLPCVCRPEGDLMVAPVADAAVWGRAVVRAVAPLAPAMVRVTVEPATPLYYRAGQFIALRRADGLVRSYSLASVPRLDRGLQIHVRRLPGGVMSNWVHDRLAPGEALDIQGPNGASFYVEGRPDQPMLLIATGSGLGALFAIARDALASGHRGEIRLYHGSRHPGGLYLRKAQATIAACHPNFIPVACVSGAAVPAGARAGRADAAAFADRPELAGWRVHLCGNPAMVAAARKRAYLAGARLDDIDADPFVLKDLRRRPRD